MDNRVTSIITIIEESESSQGHTYYLTYQEN